MDGVSPGKKCNLWCLFRFRIGKKSDTTVFVWISFFFKQMFRFILDFTDTTDRAHVSAGSATGQGRLVHLCQSQYNLTGWYLIFKSWTPSCHKLITYSNFWIFHCTFGPEDLTSNTLLRCSSYLQQIIHIWTQAQNGYWMVLYPPAEYLRARPILGSSRVNMSILSLVFAERILF